MESKIIKISCGLSGTVALSRDGFAYVWGRFGKLVYNLPKKISNKLWEDSLSRH